MIRFKAAQTRRFFFDRRAVARALDRATRRALTRFGAFVRTRARSSLRRRKRSSAPGHPPTSRTGLLKRFLYFAYEPHRRAVVIGPARLNASHAYGPTTVPELLETGGTVKPQPRRGHRRRPARTKPPATYAPRPYMGPAYQAELPKAPALWRNSLRS